VVQRPKFVEFTPIRVQPAIVAASKPGLDSLVSIPKQQCAELPEFPKIVTPS